MMVLPDPKANQSACFPRSARLLTPAAYAAVFEQRRARRGRFFHLHIGQRPDTEAGQTHRPGPRLGIAVPKKLLKTAVHRNLVKRIARESFRQIAPNLDHHDFVLRLSVKLDPGKWPLDRTALRDDIGTLFAGGSSIKPEARLRSSSSANTTTNGQTKS